MTFCFRGSGVREGRLRTPSVRSPPSDSSSLPPQRRRGLVFLLLRSPRYPGSADQGLSDRLELSTVSTRGPLLGGGVTTSWGGRGGGPVPATSESDRGRCPSVGYSALGLLEPRGGSSHLPLPQPPRPPFPHPRPGDVPCPPSSPQRTPTGAGVHSDVHTLRASRTVTHTHTSNRHPDSHTHLPFISHSYPHCF